jgi:hypothetical protein
MSEKTGIGATPQAQDVGEIPEIGIGMLGYAFMGKAHANAYKKLAYMTWPPPLMPEQYRSSRRDANAVSWCREPSGRVRVCLPGKPLIGCKRLRF